MISLSHYSLIATHLVMEDGSWVGPWNPVTQLETNFGPGWKTDLEDESSWHVKRISDASIHTWRMTVHEEILELWSMWMHVEIPIDSLRGAWECVQVTNGLKFHRSTDLSWETTFVGWLAETTHGGSACGAWGIRRVARGGACERYWRQMFHRSIDMRKLDFGINFPNCIAM